MTRFQSMFNQLKRHRESLEAGVLPVILTIEPPTQEEVEERQQPIERLIEKRYLQEDNDYLRITCMNSFEKNLVYSDAWPLLRLRLKLWWLFK